MKNGLCIRLIAIIFCLSCVIAVAGCSLTRSDDNKTDNQGSKAFDSQSDVANNYIDESDSSQDAMNSIYSNVAPPTEAESIDEIGNSADESYDSQDDKNHIMPTVAPPIQAESIDEIVTLLKKADTNGYRKKFQAQYQSMFALFNDVGYIYQVVTSNNAVSKDAISLLEIDGNNIYNVLPYAKFEDVGIYSYVTFRENLYLVCVYIADRNISTDARSISEYLEKRLTIKSASEMTVGSNTVCFTNGGDLANSFIDDTYYYTIETEASQDDLKDFVNALSFEKISFVTE